MKLILDFTKHQSIGNVNDENSKDNHKSFENAKALYKKDKKFIQDTILSNFENFGSEIIIGKEISIPVQHLPNAGFMNHLKFIVTAVNEKEVNLSLTGVVY